MTAADFQPGLQAPRPLEASDLLFVARGLELVVRKEGEGLALADAGALRPLADRLHYLGRLGERLCFTANLQEGVEPEAPLRLAPARALFDLVDGGTFAAAGRALAVAEWDRTSRFCGRCGTPTEPDPNERVRRCPACRTPFYPRLSPAVIVLVEREDTILLARNAAFPGAWFSTLAGFVEPGESLEEAVHREVAEEVGVTLTELRYFGSQPWPFGRSLMIGFNARYAGGEVRADGTEIAEARFFSPDALPRMPPPLSIARQLIDAWVARHRR